MHVTGEEQDRARSVERDIRRLGQAIDQSGGEPVLQARHRIAARQRFDNLQRLRYAAKLLRAGDVVELSRRVQPRR